MTRCVQPRRRLASALSIGAVTLWMAIVGPSVRASVVVPLSLVELTAAADLVALGTVEDVRTVQGPTGIERLVQVRLTSPWKGPEASVVYVRLAGGQLGRLETRVPGVPNVDEGARVVWFLAAHPRGGYSVIGLHQGALAAAGAPDGTWRVLAPSRVANARGAVSRVPRAVTDLEAEVRALAGTEGAQ